MKTTKQESKLQYAEKRNRLGIYDNNVGTLKNIFEKAILDFNCFVWELIIVTLLNRLAWYS